LRGNSGAWHPVRLRGVKALAGAATDRQGGLWLRRDWDNIGTPPGIVHYARGTLTPVRMPVRAGQRAGILDIAAIPGTDSVWAVGAFMNNGSRGAYTAVIMKYGRRQPATVTVTVRQAIPAAARTCRTTARV